MEARFGAGLGEYQQWFERNQPPHVDVVERVGPVSTAHASTWPYALGS
jgi:hypothetical protein